MSYRYVREPGYAGGGDVKWIECTKCGGTNSGTENPQDLDAIDHEAGCPNAGGGNDDGH